MVKVVDLSQRQSEFHDSTPETNPTLVKAAHSTARKMEVEEKEKEKELEALQKKSRKIKR